MTLYLHERKYELDSLCAGTVSQTQKSVVDSTREITHRVRWCLVMKLSTQYYNLTKDATPFNAEWLKAMGTIVTIITEMQEVKK